MIWVIYPVGDLGELLPVRGVIHPITHLHFLTRRKGVIYPEMEVGDGRLRGGGHSEQPVLDCLGAVVGSSGVAVSVGLVDSVVHASLPAVLAAGAVGAVHGCGSLRSWVLVLGAADSADPF